MTETDIKSSFLLCMALLVKHPVERAMAVEPSEIVLQCQRRCLPKLKLLISHSF